MKAFVSFQGSFDFVSKLGRRGQRFIYKLFYMHLCSGNTGMDRKENVVYVLEREEVADSTDLHSRHSEDSPRLTRGLGLWENQ